MTQISIQPIPSQKVSVVLEGQNVQIALYQKSQGLFVDINSDGDNVSLAVLARDTIPLNSRNYANFIGNLFLIDTQGVSDPFYTGLGDRWKLVYLTQAELVTYGFLQ